MGRSGTSIRLFGADGEHHAAMSAPESRAFEFPDGVRRIITLPHRYWHAYDVLDAAWGFQRDYETLSYQWALERRPADAAAFESWLRYFFRQLIETGWTVYNEDQRQNGNQNR